MRKSHLWYPVARALERRIVYHAGPTNSGKTYEALQVGFPDPSSSEMMPNTRPQQTTCRSFRTRMGGAARWQQTKRSSTLARADGQA